MPICEFCESSYNESKTYRCYTCDCMREGRRHSTANTMREDNEESGDALKSIGLSKRVKRTLKIEDNERLGEYLCPECGIDELLNVTIRTYPNGKKRFRISDYADEVTFHCGSCDEVYSIKRIKTQGAIKETYP